LAAPFPVSSDTDIFNAIETYPNGRLGAIAQNSDPFNNKIYLAIKYMSVDAAQYYRGAKVGQFNISSTVGFTWGAGTYVAPLAYPTSSAIFGRLGVVAQFNPSGWKVFDAVDPKNQDLYLSWTWRQPLFRHRLSMLTKGSAFYNQELRNRFRSHFNIDCVLFPPDQINRDYTKLTDVWMCVTDWKSPSVIMKEGLSSKFTVAKVCALADEEFYDVDEGIKRKAHLNPGGRLLTNDSDVAKLIAQRYFAGHDWVRIEA
jgi:hypothetical protein